LDFFVGNTTFKSYSSRLLCKFPFQSYTLKENMQPFLRQKVRHRGFIHTLSRILQNLLQLFLLYFCAAYMFYQAHFRDSLHLIIMFTLHALPAIAFLPPLCTPPVSFSYTRI